MKIKQNKMMFIALSMAVMMVSVAKGELKVGFYRETCPSAERIVRTIVAKAVTSNPGMAAGIIRLHFHDCIVLGCDASILLDSPPGKPGTAEKDSPGNPLLRGFEIIDAAKAELESHCKQTVSCADILAFAARDSVATTGGFSYAVPSGRRDSLVSHGDQVFSNVPPITSNITLLKQHFLRRGLSLNDVVALSGAHSIGMAPCAAFFDRLYFFNGTSTTDPSLSPEFAKFLKAKCPQDAGFDKIADLDNVTPNRLDVQYFVNLKKKMGVLASDQALESDDLTAGRVSRYVDDGDLWRADFAAAMVKMGKMMVLTGTEGEIRTSCSVVN